MQRIREIFNDLREQVRSALSPEQQEELRSKISSGATDRLQRLRDALQKLGLNEDQKEKIKSLFEDLRGKMEAARKEGAPGGQEAAEKLRAAGADLRGKLAEILTGEQREKLRELMESNAAPATQPRPNKPAPWRFCRAASAYSSGMRPMPALASGFYTWITGPHRQH